jgi:hypothetical protein
MAEVGLTGVPFLPVVVHLQGQEFFIDQKEAEHLISDLNISLLELDQEWLNQQMQVSDVNWAEQPEDFALSTLGG